MTMNTVCMFVDRHNSNFMTQEQLRAENEELKWRRKKDEDWQKANDQRVRCYHCHGCHDCYHCHGCYDFDVCQHQREKEIC